MRKFCQTPTRNNSKVLAGFVKFIKYNSNQTICKLWGLKIVWNKQIFTELMEKNWGIETSTLTLAGQDVTGKWSREWLWAIFGISDDNLSPKRWSGKRYWQFLKFLNFVLNLFVNINIQSIKGYCTSFLRNRFYGIWSTQRQPSAWNENFTFTNVSRAVGIQKRHPR